MKSLKNTRGWLIASLCAVGISATVISLAAARQKTTPPKTLSAGFTQSSAQKRMLTPAALSAAEKTRTAGMVARDHKKLSFKAKSIRLVVHTGPENDMLSFRIAGLRNPTLVIPKGATLKVLFANTDDDMVHDFRVGRPTVPFDSSPTKDGTVGSSPLAPRGKTAFSAEELVLRAPAHAGSFTYYCVMSGHASGGMWGKIQVR